MAEPSEVVEVVAVPRPGADVRRSAPTFSALAARLRHPASAFLPFLAILILWQLFGASSGPRSIFLPTPLSVLKALGALFSELDFYEDIGWSIYRVTVGFLLSVAVAVPLGFCAGRFKTMASLIHPINDFTRYLPVASLIPLCILWVGIGDLNKILVIFLGTVFQLIPLVSDTAGTVPQSLIDMTRVYGASRREVVTRVVIPWCMPTIYDHCRVSLGWAWSYLIVAELVATTSGIGRVIIQAQRFIQTPRVIAGIIVIGLLGLIFDQGFRRSKPSLFPWV
jgi:NitT/TauT family transport system permease protein